MWNKETKLKSTILLMAAALAVCMAGVSYGLVYDHPDIFDYQGRLIDSNDAADGPYDFEFRLYDDPNVIDGNQVGSDVNVVDVDVIEGYFTVALDFNDPNAFNGGARWLEIAVRPGDSNDPCDFTTLSPRQEITPTPYAIHAYTSCTAHSLGAPGGPTDAVYVADNGNVGIGTTSPSEVLDVNGDIKVNNIRMNNSDITDKDSIRMIIDRDDDQTDQTFSVWKDEQQGGPVGTELFRIQENGNVGIGTTSPAATIDVNGTLALQDGPAINEISTDGTLADNSDLAVPTEQAVKTYVDSASGASGAGLMPVGGVVAWIKNFPNTPSLPNNFEECNGQTINDSNSPYDEQTIPNLNTGTQRFLRGSTTSGATGGSETHTHTVPMGEPGASQGSTAYASNTNPATSSATSTLPSYYEVVWIMRVK